MFCGSRVDGRADGMDATVDAAHPISRGVTANLDDIITAIPDTVIYFSRHPRVPTAPLALLNSPTWQLSSSLTGCPAGLRSASPLLLHVHGS